MAVAPLLLCLDLQQSMLGAEGPTARRLRVAATRRVMDRARATDWELAHLCRTDLAGPAAPLPGLGPLPCEAIYRREGVCAFGARHFPELLARRGRTATAILAFDVGGAALVTALTAADRGHEMILLTDASENACVVEAVGGLVEAVKQTRVRLCRFREVAVPVERRLTLAANQP